ncbi:hypothetical protein [Rhodohalobacter sp.]|uniref:hypothetical protein n=1 Tax=Rhodohalobacter sp. TaxID=1974210 RepID=UPI002ACD1FD4|nr:hypothetical protein [Rhodohalobacter sp.]MDZ7757742.1 hypothetical protein [Rhodohalobacter sp.]
MLKNTVHDISGSLTLKDRYLRNILTVLLCIGFITMVHVEHLEAQEVSLRYGGTELMTDDPVLFARSMQASSRSGESVLALCAVVVFDSEGQHWGTYVSEEPAEVGSGRPAECWTPDMRNVLPGRQLGRNDRVLPNGLTINSGHTMAQPAPVTADVPLPPDLFATALLRNNPDVESLAESIGYPPQMPRSVTKRPRWVAASFLLIPLSESGRELSRDYQSTSVNLLLGER